MIEKEILGCFLKDNSLINDTIIQENQFFESSYQLIFQSMKRLASENKSIDKVTLLSDNYKSIQDIGGTNFITDIETSGNTDNFDSYEREFIDSFKKRESENIAKDWLSNKNKKTENLISDLQKLDNYGYSDEQDKNAVLEMMHDLPFIDSEEAGVPSGFDSLDALTGGFHKTSSYIMGARPSMGKSATMLKFALAAMNSNAVPLIFSLEMSKESLLRRLIATIGDINLFIARNPQKLQKSKKDNWVYAVNELYKQDFEIFDKPMQTIQYIRSNVRKAKKQHEGKQIIVLIDYLTLIESPEQYHSDHSKISDISAKIKGIAREYDCPVITLAQLSRAVEMRNDKRPMLSDLRESGSIEQDADAVLFLYRDSYYNDGAENDNLEIIVAKHRDGPTGTTTVYYNKATGKMGDLYDFERSS